MRRLSWFIAAAILAASGSLPSVASASEPTPIDVCKPTPEHPRNDHQLIFLRADGTLLLVWSEYYVPAADAPAAVQSQTDEKPCRISAKTSTDGGRTWGDDYELQANTGRFNVKNPSLLRLPSGELLFFYTVWNTLQDRAPYVRRSADEGRTWSEPLRIAADAGITNINADHALALRTGRIVLPAFHSPTLAEGQHFQAFCFYSDDGGHHWQASDNKIDLPKRGAEEPSIVELRDGTLLAVLRTSLGSVYQARSSDAGKTWGPPTTTGLPAPASPPIVKRLPAGDLLLIWNRNYEPAHHHQGERRPLSAAVSTDEGLTWRHVGDIETAPGGAAAYPAVTFLDGEALVTYYYQPEGFGGASGIRLKRIPLEWFAESANP
jgi:sialidase-1